CVQVEFSDDLLKPRWRKPISGTASTMVSPSRVTTSRTVPCIAGCEGPRFTVIRLEGSSCSSPSGSSSWASSSAIVFPTPVRAAHVGLAHRHARAARGGAGAAYQVGEVQLGHQELPLAHRVVLAQRVPLELRVQEDAREVRMADELHSEHVVDVALPPVGGA